MPLYSRSAYSPLRPDSGSGARPLEFFSTLANAVENTANAMRMRRTDGFVRRIGQPRFFSTRRSTDAPKLTLPPSNALSMMAAVGLRECTLATSATTVCRKVTSELAPATSMYASNSAPCAKRGNQKPLVSEHATEKSNSFPNGRVRRY
eukprot:5354835-Pyramimonas_sp.AAC.2